MAIPVEKNFDEGISPQSCPANLALDLLSRKWSMHILITLIRAEGPVRFGELQRRIAGISQRELTKQLREFEKFGILTRHVFPQVPPRVEYQLTDIGRSLMGPIEALHDWAAANGPRILAASSNPG